MAGFVDSTVNEIDNRLRELKEELSRLEAARSALIGAHRGPGRPRGSRSGVTRRRASGRGPGRPRGRRGSSRSKQALELVREQPGITIPQIAQKLSIAPNYLYRVMPKLVADGQIKRDGEGWLPTSSGRGA